MTSTRANFVRYAKNMALRSRIIAVSLVTVLGAAVLSPNSWGGGDKTAHKTSSDRTNLKIGWILDPPSVLPRGASFSAAVSIENSGKKTSPQSETAFYLTKELRPASLEHLVGRSKTRRLKSGASVVRDVRVQIENDLPAGRYFLYVCADSKKKVRESSERDNCVSSATDVLITDAF